MISTIKSLSKTKIVLLGIFTLYLLLGFFLIPKVVKNEAIKTVDAKLNAKLQIQKVYFNPILLSLELQNVELRDNNRVLMSFKHLEVDFDLARTLTNFYVHFKLIELQNPIIHLEIDKNKELNFLSLLQKDPTEQTKKTEETKPNRANTGELFKLQLDKLAISNAKVSFTDNSLKTPFSTTLDKLNFQLHDLNTLPEHITALTFDTYIDKHAQLKAQAGIDLDSMKAYGTLDLLHFSPIPFWKSIKHNYPIELNEKLLANAHVGFLVSNQEALNVQINQSSLELKNLSITDLKANKLLELNHFMLDDVNIAYPLDPNLPGVQTTATLLVNEGELETTSSVQLQPFDAQVTFDMTQFPLDILNHALMPYVTFNIDSAYVQSSGSLKVNAQNEITFSSDTQVNDIQLSKAKQTIVKTDTITLNSLQFDSKKNGLSIKSVDVLKPYAYVHINKQSELNLAQLTKEQAKNKKKQEKPHSEKQVQNSPTMHINIGPMQIKKGHMTFEDETLPIPFKTNSKKLNGYFSHFNTQSSKPSKLKLEGQVGQYGHLLINGETTHNDIKETTNVKLSFANISIHDLTPYSGKFIGREVDEGKLSLDLSYTIKQAQLQASNNIIIEQIKLGDTIESEEAVNLPLELAIAILEDSNGVIDLNLPINGDLDNPEFNVGPIVWKAFTNLITKALTAPFSLLGSLFGFGEDEINTVHFSYGLASITPIQKEPLDKLAQILEKRDKLAIELSPTYDTKGDLHALKTVAFESMVQKAMEEVKDKNYQKNYLAFLEKSYESYDLDSDDLKEQFESKDAFDALAYEKALKESIIDNQVIKPEALVDLAHERVNNIKNYLTTQFKVAPKQIHLNDTLVKKEFEKNTVINLDVETAN